MVARAPGFTAVVSLTLALGIGANTAIFSVVYALLLRPLPYHDPDRIVMVWQDMTARGGPAREWTTPGNFADLAGEPVTFQSVTAVRGWQPTITRLGDPEPLVGEQVSHEYFTVLGVAPARGRAFSIQDDVPGAPRVAILSHGLWVRRFGSDAAVLGRQVMLGGEPHEVVGVMPESFRPAVVADAEIWRPARLNRATPSRGMVVLRTLARLAPGVDLERARLSAQTIAGRLQQTYPDDNQGVTFALVPLHEQIVGDIRTSLLVLLAAVGFVLLIACANVANLLLARASGRQREMAVRVALGARRTRVVRQLLTESLLLAVLGGVLGLLVATWGVDALSTLLPTNLPALGGVHGAAGRGIQRAAGSGIQRAAGSGIQRAAGSGIQIEWHMLAFGAAVTLGTGLLFGLMPAIQASRSSPGSGLKEGARGTAGRGGQRARRGLVVGEIAIALVVMVGSGLLLRTFLHLQSANLGFQPSGVVVGSVITPQVKYPNREALVAFYDRLLERASALPGVQTAALSSNVPLGGDNDMDVAIEGQPPPPPGHETTTWYRLISADYMKAMGIGMRSGRSFAPRESAPSVIVNETAARRFWPGEDPVGRRVRFAGPNGGSFTVIGVAGDVSMRGARGEPRAEMYLPYWQFVEAGTNVVLKSAGGPESLDSLAAGLRAAVKSIDPDMPVSDVAPMARHVGDSIAQPRLLAVLVSVFAGLAMALSAIGIYGTMSYSVVQRTAEIGVRMALGADRRAVFALVARDGVLLAGTGIAIGTTAALLMGRSLATLLYAVTPGDPVTFVATVATLLAAALAATVLPARRATRVDPLVALRTE
jgi:putative ABC transport system permease protein